MHIVSQLSKGNIHSIYTKAIAPLHDCYAHRWLEDRHAISMLLAWMMETKPGAKSKASANVWYRECSIPKTNTSWENMGDWLATEIAHSSLEIVSLVSHQLHLRLAAGNQTLPILSNNPSKAEARHHVSALCWPIGCSRCSDLKIFVQERCQLVTCFHLCCLMGCRPSTCERSIEKRNVNRSLECVVNLILLIAPAPYTLARGQLFGKNLLEPVLQAHHCGLSLQ